MQRVLQRGVTSALKAMLSRLLGTGVMNIGGHQQLPKVLLPRSYYTNSQLHIVKQKEPSRGKVN
jgi:hypothetical protein